MNANAAWLVLAAISFNLTRAAGTLASRFHTRPPPPRSAPSSSRSLPASPAPQAGSACTCPSGGPGKPPGRRCSPPPQDHPPTRPDHPARVGATKDPKWKTRTDRHPTRARIKNYAAPARSDLHLTPTAGSRLNEAASRPPGTEDVALVAGAAAARQHRRARARPQRAIRIFRRARQWSARRPPTASSVTRRSHLAYRLTEIPRRRPAAARE